MDFDEEMNQSPEHVAVVANVALRQEIDVVAASDLLYTVSGKKRTNSILGITSSNTGRFSKFFQRRNLEEICNKTVVKFPTIPQTRRYTTL